MFDVRHVQTGIFKYIKSSKGLSKLGIKKLL